MSIPRLFAAIAVAAAVVLSAPFISQIRSWIRATFPGQFVLIIGGIVAAAIAAALLGALFRIRDRRALRYGAIAAALTLGIAYAAAISTPDAQANAVERFHFVEYGLVTFLFYRAARPRNDASVFVVPLLAGIIVGTLEEWLQWFIPVRVGEMRDVFLNAAAIVCGLLFSVAVDPPSSRWVAFRPGSAVRLGVFAAATAIVFGAFVQVVHLGYAIRDSEAGTFNSRYDRATLASISADRASRWAAAAPVVRRVSREDQYLSEGILHVQERNRRWEAGDVRAAWLENRILEKYYEPVLDTTYPAPAGPPHRWPDGQRADAEQRARAAVGEGYVSAADGGFIRTWSLTRFWVAVIAMSCGLVALGYALERSLARQLARGTAPPA